MKKSAGMYDTDFYCWALENAALLRQRKFDQLDVDNLADEIEDMGKRDRREVRSKLRALLTHFLKWQFQPERRSRSWSETILRERIELPEIFAQSPSLRRYAAEDLNSIYTDAVAMASNETGLPQESFPSDCSFTVDQILDRAFLPGRTE